MSTEMNWKEYSILKKIRICVPNKKFITIKEFCQLIEIDRRHPYVSKIRKLLLENNISKEESYLSNELKIFIDFKKLENLIENTKNFKEYDALYIKKTRLLWDAL